MEIWNFVAPSDEEVCEQTQLVQRVAIILVNAEPAVVTVVVNSYSLLKSMKECRLAAIFHLSSSSPFYSL
jgi:hypothetical protein